MIFTNRSIPQGDRTCRVFFLRPFLTNHHWSRCVAWSWRKVIVWTQFTYAYIHDIRYQTQSVNTLRSEDEKNWLTFCRRNFQMYSLLENCILIKITLKFVHRCPINTKPSLDLIMAWHRTGASLYRNQWWYSILMHKLCVTRPQRWKK